MNNSPLDQRKEEVLQTLASITQQEHHFNQLEADYRKLASQWLLAVFAGLGFVAKGDADPFPVDRFVLMGLICLAGACGIWLLWLLDIRVYHRLLHSAFMRGYELEQQLEWLPKVRTAMIQSVKGGDVTGIVVYYYALMFGGLILLAGCLLSWANWQISGHLTHLAAAVFITFFCLAWSGVFWMKKCSRPQVKL